MSAEGYALTFPSRCPETPPDLYTKGIGERKLAMTPGDPVLLLASWLLCWLSFAAAIQTQRARARGLAEAGKTYSGWMRVQDLLLPAGFGVVGARFLLIGYGILPAYGFGSVVLLLLATLGIAGGVAASRIRRMPD
ncbi:MAG: hypothetical protein KY468_10900 [Armatimonadetes bacterium]|nr:hypothetical protein [Armatimonadota bacterium]